MTESISVLIFCSAHLFWKIFLSLDYRSVLKRAGHVWNLAGEKIGIQALPAGFILWTAPAHAGWDVSQRPRGLGYSLPCSFLSYWPPPMPGSPMSSLNAK